MTVVDAEARFHVLAVDDSVIDRKLIEMLLRTSSYQVTMVDSGSKALEVLGLRDEGDDDSSSPSSSAPDHHQGSSSLKDIPVVIMSSENVPARISRCLEDGAEEFFLKPVKLADMKKLKSHLAKYEIVQVEKATEEWTILNSIQSEAEVVANCRFLCEAQGRRRSETNLSRTSSPTRSRSRGQQPTTGTLVHPALPA
ncbi:unnamed protein product [Triticum turgidum subsp. durum]|uniref:Response regulatory domain-containing protein n=1 Tax=Triticum turgidum subsp. durum TaxID=4567 RepID=A0A9R0RZQ6_TRITD|nr:unnamed protein product [Triticum turgidum subsp. durum]